MKLVFHSAHEADIPSIIDMLADDALGARREDLSKPVNQRYIKAFSHISRDPNNELSVVECGGEAAGMMQLTYIPHMTHVGSWRCLIEGVRIEAAYRGRGLGSKFFAWAIDRARQRHCSIVQLTSDKQGPDAQRFYQALGFSATHEGCKLELRA